MVKMVLSFVLLLTLVYGCGFKGPLYLPPQKSSNKPSAPAHSVESANLPSSVHESQVSESRVVNYSVLNMNKYSESVESGQRRANTPY